LLLAPKVVPGETVTFPPQKGGVSRQDCNQGILD
jgi:hypothetical protein